MNRFETWKKQGEYRTADGMPYILVMDKETGATVLEPLHKYKTCPECGKPKPKLLANGNCAECNQ